LGGILVFIVISALHHAGCRAALNLTWFRAQSAFYLLLRARN